MRLSAERSDGSSVFAFCLLNGIVITGRRLAYCWALLFKMEGVSNQDEFRGRSKPRRNRSCSPQTQRPRRLWRWLSSC